MADDDCWAIRAQADALQSEVSTLRGAVAALRGSRARSVVASPLPRLLPTAARGSWQMAALAFALGVAMTLAVVALFVAALCP